MMNSPDQSPNMFYLGFNKDTGELEEVVVPKGKTLWLDPIKFKELKKGKEGKLSEDERKKVEDAIWNAKLKASIGDKKKIDLEFIDLPGSSVCCGSCGGIPFCWC